MTVTRFPFSLGFFDRASARDDPRHSTGVVVSTPKCAKTT